MKNPHAKGQTSPERYDFVGSFYQGSSRSILETDFETPATFRALDISSLDELQELTPADGHYARRRSCDACGAFFAFGEVFRHDSGQIVVVGWTCAEWFGAGDIAQARVRDAKRRAEQHKKSEQLREQKAIWDAERATNNFKVYGEQLWELGRQIEAAGLPLDSFPADVLGTGVTGSGRTTERSLDAAFSAVKREVADKNRVVVAPSGPLVEGRYTLYGEVVSTRWDDGIYGPVFKMLVALDTGHRVWGSVPQGLRGGKIETGTRVVFDAKVERSERDDTFGFFSRPTKARLADVVTA